ncbi:MAG: glycosyltransferase family 87 protein [Candidatus Sumerlaeia bacterium]|nr:glycosyltransferase family 87 protein [Candidatus Sumerlaeia bacterium]
MILLLGLYVHFQVFTILGHHPGGIPKSNQNDFKHIYLGAMLLSEGESPYDRELLYEYALAEGITDPRFVQRNADGTMTPRILPFVYLPFTGVVLIPLTFFGFQTAVDLFILLNAILLIAGLWLILAAERQRLTVGLLVVTLLPVVLSFSVWRSHTAGQLNTILFFGAALLYWELAQPRGSRFAVAWVSGAIAAFLMLFKITPGIFLIWFLLTRRWAEAAWMLVLSVAVTLLLAVVFGFDTHWAFLPLLADMGFGKSTWGDVGFTFWRDAYNISLNAFFHRTLVEWPGMQPWYDLGPFAANSLTWVCALGILAAFAGAVPRPKPEPLELVVRAPKREFTPLERLWFALAVLTSLLAPSIFWDHYLVQAHLPALVLWIMAAPCGRYKFLYRGIVILFWVVSALGFEAGSVTLHTGMLGVANWVHGGVPLAGGDSPWKLVWMNAKLVPVLLLFASILACMWQISVHHNQSWNSLEANKNSRDDA